MKNPGMKKLIEKSKKARIRKGFIALEALLSITRYMPFDEEYCDLKDCVNEYKKGVLQNYDPYL